MKVIAIVFLYLTLQMSVVWVLYRLIKNPSVVDSSWSIGLMMSGFIYLLSTPFTSRNILVVILLSLWSLRLAGFLWYTRVHKGHIDKRYTEISNNWKISKSLGFFLNFQLQGWLIFIISFVFYLIGTSVNANITLLDIIAVIIVFTGIVGETTADLQLYKYKEKKLGGVCNNGLWNYSRHPNYFFDWSTWLGFSIFSFQSKYGYLGLISILVLYIIFTKITGPLTERGSVKSRGKNYIDYQKQTSMFFPWFKKKNDSV
jgi:steroid 5-alpha reductase family enzyme